MKRTLFFLFIATALYVASSCTKANNVTTTIHDSTTVIIRDTVVKKDTVVIASPKNPITGLWVGTYKIYTSTADSFYYSFAIRTDGTVIASGGGTLGESSYAMGPWTLTGTSFTARITTMDGTTPENVQTVAATYDSVGGVLANGQWVDVVGGTTGHGTFNMRRVQ